MALSTDGSYAVCDVAGCLARADTIVTRRPDPVRLRVTANAWGVVSTAPAEEVVVLPPAGWTCQSVYGSVSDPVFMGEPTKELWLCEKHSR